MLELRCHNIGKALEVLPFPGTNMCLKAHNYNLILAKALCLSGGDHIHATVVGKLEGEGGITLSERRASIQWKFTFFYFCWLLQ